MSFVFSHDRRRVSLCCQGRSFSSVQRDRWRRKFNSPEIIAAKKFEGQAHILAAARNLPIDYPRPDAPAAFWIYDIYFVSNFETVMTSEGTAMLAQEDCFCGIIIDIATRLLPPQHERYASCNPSTSPSPATGCGSHVDLNSSVISHPLSFQLLISASSRRYSQRQKGPRHRGSGIRDFLMCNA